MKALIPIDVWQLNSDLSQDLCRILPLKEADITLVYAIQSEPHVDKNAPAGEYNADYLYADLEKKAKLSLDESAQELKKYCATAETRFEHGQPASVIESLAKEKEVDLTIIRGSATSLLESTILGNTVSSVIKHCPSSVLVLRAGSILSPLKKVIVALDGSEHAKNALRKFCQLYKSMAKDIEIVLVHVVSIPGPWRFIAPVEFIASLEDNLDMAAKAILAEGETILKDCGWQLPKAANVMSSEMVVRSGDPAAELDRIAGEIGAGLIVVGSQGKTAVRHFLLGSVSEALALKSSYPILVLKQNLK